MAARIFTGKITLRDKLIDFPISSSLVQLTLLPSSTHREVWKNNESLDILDERHIKTSGFTLKLLEQEFLDDDKRPLNRKIFPLLRSSLEIDYDFPDLVFKIVDNVRTRLLKNVNSSASTGSGNKLWRIWMELDIVTTYYLLDKPGDGLKQVTLSSSNEMCTICMEDFPVGSCVMSMHCSHIFHRSCIVRWLIKTPHCPVCREIYTLTEHSSERVPQCHWIYINQQHC
uniref:RING-type domain-containing protein n=1 Tax=Fagus sylvatica TaxID=28930 RepID=A0A2N9IAJ6_FAGSY